MPEKIEVRIDPKLEKELKSWLHDFNAWIRIVNTRLDVLGTVSNSQMRCLKLLQTIVQAKDETIDEVAQSVADEAEHLNKLLQSLGEKSD